MVDFDCQSFEEANERAPLMPSDAALIAKLDEGNDTIGRHILTVHGEDSWVWKGRKLVQRFFTCKWGHYWIIILVSFDISLIFADFLISLHICEHMGSPGFDPKPWTITDDVLAEISYGLSWVFMIELILSVWAFGFSGYFNSKFHTFDAAVIVAGFIIDILTHGVVIEVTSLVVIGRLWRVFKIIEEFSSAGDDQMGIMRVIIADLKAENLELRKSVTYEEINENSNK